MPHQDKQLNSRSQKNEHQYTHNDKWFNKLQELSDFKMHEGHCRVPAKFKHNPSLGKWVRTQREQHRYTQQGKPSPLTDTRFQALESIGFTWNINKTSNKSRLTWMNHYEQLKEFKDREKHCKVPQKFAKNPSLGRWVMTQRIEYKQMKQGKSQLSKDKLQLLEEIGFTWDINGSNSEVWMDRYNALKKFKEQEGHCRVPRSYFEDPALANWVSFQRKQNNYMKQGKTSTMTEKRYQLLDDVGFIWSIYGEDSNTWMDHYEELKDFTAQEGHCVVPVKYEKNPSLGLWVVTQRQHYKYMKQGKASIMTEQRMQQLNNIGFAWNAKMSNKNNNT